MWQQRLQSLEEDLPGVSDNDRPGLEERIDFLRTNLAARGRRRPVFPAVWSGTTELRLQLGGSADGLATLLPGFNATDAPWRTKFLFGAWDADVQSFFVAGTLEIHASGSVPPSRLYFGARSGMSDMPSS